MLVFAIIQFMLRIYDIGNVNQYGHLKFVQVLRLDLILPFKWIIFDKIY